jgi:hypothetical protein
MFSYNLNVNVRVLWYAMPRKCCHAVLSLYDNLDLSHQEPLISDLPVLYVHINKPHTRFKILKNS